MHTYSCKVRLAGSVMNEVRKTDLLAAEVVLLRFIHGEDAVTEVRNVGEIKLTQEEAKAHMMQNYVERSPEVAALVAKIFPTVAIGAGELPTKIASIELAEPEIKRPATRPAVAGVNAALA